MTSALKLYRIEIDGHFHGSRQVPRPWVARIDGPCDRYGLARTFIDPMRDYRGYRRAMSGNEYGVVATFPLRSGHLYEVSRLRGRSSKRHVSREFYWLDGQEMQPLEPAEALDRVEGGDGRTLRLVDAGEESSRWVARVTGLGRPRPVAFVADDRDRIYRLRIGGLFEVVGEQRRLVVSTETAVTEVTDEEAWAWLREHQTRSSAA